MILHLCYDGNFINDIVPAFKKYYPGRNIFLVNKEKNKCRILKDDFTFKYVRFIESNYNIIEKICVDFGVKSIILHGLHCSNVNLLYYLTKRRKYDVYWFFGDMNCIYHWHKKIDIICWMSHYIFILISLIYIQVDITCFLEEFWEKKLCLQF